jgi:hypothetical protein
MAGDAPPGCARCSAALKDGELLTRWEGKLHSEAEVPAVLCPICRAGIACPSDVVMTPMGPMHPRCAGERAT